MQVIRQPAVMSLNGFFIPGCLNMRAIYGSLRWQGLYELIQCLKIKRIDLCEGMPADIFQHDDFFVLIFAFRDDGGSRLISGFGGASKGIGPLVINSLFEWFV